jgi:hypothetical protein
MDAYWSYENADRSITDPSRMTAVVGVITDLLQSQNRAEDAQGALFWAGKWLKQRLEEDAE